MSSTRTRLETFTLPISPSTGKFKDPIFEQEKEQKTRILASSKGELKRLRIELHRITEIRRGREFYGTIRERAHQ